MGLLLHLLTSYPETSALFLCRRPSRHLGGLPTDHSWSGILFQTTQKNSTVCILWLLVHHIDGLNSTWTGFSITKTIKQGIALLWPRRWQQKERLARKGQRYLSINPAWRRHFFCFPRTHTPGYGFWFLPPCPASSIRYARVPGHAVFHLLNDLCQSHLFPFLLHPCSGREGGHGHFPSVFSMK